MLKRIALAASVLLAPALCLGAVPAPKKPTAAAATSASASASATKGWNDVGFGTALCGYAPPIPVIFSLPPGFVSRDPKRGPSVGCFWATPDDLDRALRDARGAHFEEVAHGVFWFRIPAKMRFDKATGKFPDEKKLIENVIGSGTVGPRVAHETFAGNPALVVTGVTAGGAHLYVLYLSRGADDQVAIVNFRPPSSDAAGSEAVWTKFLASIRAAKK